MLRLVVRDLKHVPVIAAPSFYFLCDDEGISSFLEEFEDRQHLFQLTTVNSAEEYMFDIEYSIYFVPDMISDTYKPLEGLTLYKVYCKDVDMLEIYEKECKRTGRVYVPDTSEWKIKRWWMYDT